ncbi:MAG TPA: response regulator [Parafilimonas sp.]|nr:response regulator [Parafilimonas sp.]
MKPKSVLLVDDDIDDREFFIEALDAIENVNLFGVANNGKEALDLLTNSVSLPDHIFMDFNMPVMNGIECLTEMEKNQKTREIPVVILSGSIEQAGSARKLGAGFIKKSADIQALRTDLHRIINLNITVDYLILDQQVPVKSLGAT